jgi:hypothetical protein
MLNRIKAILSENGYFMYTRPYELNIVGIRNVQTKSNRFDDEIHVFYRTESRIPHWEYHVFRCTTDPGTYWLRNPAYTQGTAILAQGQYMDAYQIGLHRGQYEALIQRLPVKVLRDYDRNATLDFLNGKAVIGNFGINIHRASAKGTTAYIDRYSAGCQVFARAGDFATFMGLCRKHRQRYGNVFTYTLLDLRAIRRVTLKRIVLASLAVIAGTSLYKRRYN